MFRDLMFNIIISQNTIKSRREFHAGQSIFESIPEKAEAEAKTPEAALEV